MFTVYSQASTENLPQFPKDTHVVRSIILDIQAGDFRYNPKTSVSSDDTVSITILGVLFDVDVIQISSSSSHQRQQLTSQRIKLSIEDVLNCTTVLAKCSSLLNTSTLLRFCT